MRNHKKIFAIAKENTPNLQVEGRSGWLRYDVVKELHGSGNIGIELGVAAGGFSRKMLDSEKFERFYGVDAYGGGQHNTQEYISALRHIDFSNPKYCLLRMDFDSALSLFDDDFFDFIYIDGFAHTGEEGGKTLFDWVKKLKVGGVIAGDDYHSDWPLVIWAVNDFANKLGARINVTLECENGNYSKYPTWFLRKEKEVHSATVDQHLYDLAMKEKKRISRRRSYTAAWLQSVRKRLAR